MELGGVSFDELQNLRRKDLQGLAKKFGIKANLSNSAIIDALAKIVKPQISENDNKRETDPSVVEENPAPVVSAFPPSSGATFSPVPADPEETAIVRQKTPVCSPKSPKFSLASPKTSRSSDTPKQDLAFSFGSFPSFEVSDSQRPSAENSAIITSDDTISDKQRQSLDNPNSITSTANETASTAIATEPTDTQQTEPTDKQQTEPVDRVQPAPELASSAANEEPRFEEATSAAEPMAESETVSPRTRARVQQERAAARKEQLQQSNKSAVAKLVGGTPKGKPITNSAHQGLAKVAKPIAGFKARPMPDFQKIHSKQFAQKTSIDDFVSKRHETTEDSTTVIAGGPSANVSFKATTPREKTVGVRPPLRPTTPFVRSSSAPVAKFASTAPVLSAAKAKPTARPKFDLQASLAKPMTWKTHHGSDKTALKDKNMNMIVKPVAAKQSQNPGPADDAAPVKPAAAKRQSITSTENAAEAGSKRQSLASASGETAEERRKRYGESLRRATLVSH